MKDNTDNLFEFHPKPNIIKFDLKQKTFLTVSEEGIKFHTHNFPNWKLDVFAKEFVNILENSFSVRFNKKEMEE